MRRGLRDVARCGLVIALSIGIVACGSTDDDAEQADTEFPEERAAADVEASAEVLVARWGGEGAFFVVVRANDLGYRTQQIVGASDTIAADGTISGVTPEGAPLAMLIELPDDEQQSLRRAATSDDSAGTPDETPKDAYIGSVDRTMAEVFAARRQAVQQLETNARPDEEIAVQVLVALQKLGMQGYSAPQILEAFILSDVVVLMDDPEFVLFSRSNCDLAIRLGDGWLEPAFAPATGLGCTPAWKSAVRADSSDDSVAADPSEGEDESTQPRTDPATADEAYPLVFRGDGLYRITFYDSDSDGTMICEDDVEIELRLEADGRALFTYSPGMGMVRDGEEFECNEAAGDAWTGTYDAAAGTFTIAPPAEDPAREYWDVGGDFDDSTAFGPAGYSRLHPYADESGFQRNTYDFEFSILRVP